MACPFHCDDFLRQDALRHSPSVKRRHDPPAALSSDDCLAFLVRNGRRAEEAGFDFAAISDHFSPWLVRDPLPQIPREIVREAARLYVGAFEMITGESFAPPPDMPILARVRANLARFF